MLNKHLPHQRKQFEGMLKKIIELGSTLHCLLQHLRLLVNDSTTISRQGLGPIFWGIKDLV
jgi:hypothetical protein